jgi:hypothetical protein
MTNSLETGEFDVVLGDPAAFYRQPGAVLDDPTITRDERHALLTAWAQDLADRSNAMGEGMVPEANGVAERDVAMASAVAAALAALPPADESGLLAATGRLWRRLTGG